MPEIEIRFYEELNDFLPAARKKQTYLLSYPGKRTVKDLIQSQGVPHTEIDLILVNGEPVGFDYHVNHLDRISVYPVFESLDITGVSPLRGRPLRKVRFILDVHLGKLARYLRLLGFDSVYETGYKDGEIAMRAFLDKRIVLTRDIGLLKRSEVRRGYWIRNQIPKKQVTEVVQRFDLYDTINPFTCCMDCNGPIIRIEADRVRNQLKPDTLKYYNEFYQCRRCGKVYWEGSHFHRMLDMLWEFRNGSTDCEDADGSVFIRNPRDKSTP